MSFEPFYAIIGLLILFFLVLAVLISRTAELFELGPDDPYLRAKSTVWEMIHSSKITHDIRFESIEDALKAYFLIDSILYYSGKEQHGELTPSVIENTHRLKRIIARSFGCDAMTVSTLVRHPKELSVMSSFVVFHDNNTVRLKTPEIDVSIKVGESDVSEVESFLDFVVKIRSMITISHRVFDEFFELIKNKSFVIHFNLIEAE